MIKHTSVPRLASIRGHSPHKELEFQRPRSLGEVMIKHFTIQLEPVILATEHRYKKEAHMLQS